MGNFYLKTGEFASACGVKKATLVHYANLGLLKPSHIGENGYYYYGPEQIYDFELIHVMKSMNVPLSEIKDYMKNKNGDLPACQELLRKKLVELQEFQKQLQSIEQLVKNTLQDMDDLREQKLGVIEEIHFDKPQLYYIYEMTSRVADAEYYRKNSCREVIQHVQESFLNESANVVEVVMKADLLNGTFRKTYGGFRAKEDIRVDSENLLVRPAGTYLTLADHTGGNRIADLYRQLKEYADENGYRICGNGYGRDLLSHIVKRDRSHYPVRCFIQVEKQKEV